MSAPLLILLLLFYFGIGAAISLAIRYRVALNLTDRQTYALWFAWIVWVGIPLLTK